MLTQSLNFECVIENGNLKKKTLYDTQHGKALVDTFKTCV